MDAYEKTLLEGLEKLGLKLDEDKLASFGEYYRTLVEWNEFMNLTAITEKSEVYTKHFLDSLAVNVVLGKLGLDGHVRVIDVGTGAGFPGIPLKLANPGWSVTLLDSLNKRIKFLNEVIGRLGLQDITAIHGRAEDYSRDGAYREGFDLCVSRAVANLATLSEYCLPYVRQGGYFISYKSGEIEEELDGAKKAIHMLGGSVELVEKLKLPGTDIDRSFVVIRKARSTPRQYPRKAGLPSKEPIGLP